MLVDTIICHLVVSIIDGFNGYNQTNMHLYDVEKADFNTSIGNFHYTIMPFGLKNVEGIYQRVMTIYFHDILHGCLENYVDDIVANSKRSIIM